MLTTRANEAEGSDGSEPRPSSDSSDSRSAREVCRAALVTMDADHKDCTGARVASLHGAEAVENRAGEPQTYGPSVD